MGLLALASTVVLISCGAAEEAAQEATSTPAPSEPSPTAVATATAEPAGPSEAGTPVPVQPISIYAGTGGPGFRGDAGPATEAATYAPSGLALDGGGNLYIAADHRVRRVDAQTRIITTVAGTGNPGFSGDGKDATAARLKSPQGMAIDREGNLYIADRDNGRIRRVDTDGIITTVAGGGVPRREGGVLDTGDGDPATDAWFKWVLDVDVDAQGNLYLVADNRLRKIDASGVISTLAGTGLRGKEGDGGPGVDAELADPAGVVVDADGKYIYIADTDNHRVRRLEVATGVISTIAGQGIAAMGSTRDPLYAAPGTRRGGDGAGFSGDGGPAVEALLDRPGALAMGPDGNVYVADTGNDRIRMINPDTGIITTVADGGLVRSTVPESNPISGGNLVIAYVYFAPPRAVVVDQEGSIFIADASENKVVVVEP